MEEKKKAPLGSHEELTGKKAPAPKKGRGWLGILLALVVVAGALGVYYGTDWFKKAEEPAVETEDRSVRLIDLKKSDFDRATIEAPGREGYTLVSNIRYDAEGNAIEAAEGEEAAPEYAVDGQKYFALQVSPVNTMTNYLTALTAQETVDENPADLSQYGLDAPSLTVTAGYRDGSSHTIRFGDAAPAGSLCYAQFDGGKAVYALFSSVKDSFDKELSELHKTEMPLTLAAETLRSLKVSQKGKDDFAMHYVDSALAAYSLSSFHMTEPIDYDVHSTRGSELLSDVAAMKVFAYAGHMNSAADAAAWGLDDPFATIAASDADGNTLTVTVGGEAADDSRYVTVDETGDVYRMDAGLLSFLGNLRYAYLADQFTNLVNIEKVDEMTVLGPSASHTMAIRRETVKAEAAEGESAEGEAAEETVSSYFLDGQEIEEKRFKELYQAVISLQFDKPSEDAKLEGEVVYSVKYDLNDGSGAFAVEYLDYDEEYFAVRRENQTLFLIKRPKLEGMLAAFEETGAES